MMLNERGVRCHVGTYLWAHYKYVCFTPLWSAMAGSDVVPIDHRRSGRGRFQPIQIVLRSDSGALEMLRGRQVLLVRGTRELPAIWALRFPHFSAGACGSPEEHGNQDCIQT